MAYERRSFRPYPRSTTRRLVMWNAARYARVINHDEVGAAHVVEHHQDIHVRLGPRVAPTAGLAKRVEALYVLYGSFLTEAP